MGVVIPFYRRAPTAPDPSKAERIAAFRKILVERIFRMIDIVDAIDGDPDFEPSLGWTKTMATGNGFDLEENDAS